MVFAETQLGDGPTIQNEAAKSRPESLSSQANDPKNHKDEIGFRRAQVIADLAKLSESNTVAPLTVEEKKNMGEWLAHHFAVLNSNPPQNENPSITLFDLKMAYSQDNWANGKKLTANDREMLREAALHYHELALPGIDPNKIEISDISDCLKGATVTEDASHMRTSLYPDGSYVKRLSNGIVASMDKDQTLTVQNQESSITLPKTGDGFLIMGQVEGSDLFMEPLEGVRVPLHEESPGNFRGVLASGDEVSLHIDDHSFKMNMGGMSAENSGQQAVINDPEVGQLTVNGNKATYFENGETYEYSKNNLVDRLETADKGGLNYPNDAQITFDKNGITISRNADSQNILIDTSGHVFLLKDDGSKDKEFKRDENGLTGDVKGDIAVQQGNDGKLYMSFGLFEKMQAWILAPDGHLEVRHEGKVTSYEAPPGKPLALVPQLTQRTPQ
jgi:hypothetical protein